MSIYIDHAVTGCMTQAKNGEDVNFKEAMIIISLLSYQESTIHRVFSQFNPRNSDFNAKNKQQQNPPK